VQFIGDVHAGAISAGRRAVVLTDTWGLVTPAARVQVGDATDHGQPSEDATFQEWWALMGGGPLVMGNHDILPARFGGSGRTGAQWAAAYGLPSQNYTVDLGFIRLVILGMSTYPAGDAGEEMTLTAADLAWLDATLSDGVPSWICSHAPLYGTVGGGAGVYRSTDPDFSTQPDADVRAILAARPAAQAWVSGHTHSPVSAPGLLMTEVIGGRQFAHVNASAIYYTGTNPAAGGDLCSVWLTKVAGGIEARVRDHTNAVWYEPVLLEVP